MALIPVLSRVPNLIAELHKALPNYKFHEVLNPNTDNVFRKAPIIICDYDLLAPQIFNLPQAKLVQGTWAGVDAIMPYLTKPVDFQILRFSGEHFGKILSEFVVAHIVSNERDFNRVRENQKVMLWDQTDKIGDYRTIYDLIIVILGLGSIGGRIAKTLHYMGAKIMGFGKTPKSELPNEFSFVANYTNRKKELPILFDNCDYIINVLPGTPSTIRLLDGNILEVCKNKPTVFINIGRGNVISEEALLNALYKKWLSAAVLDVLEEEPLRPESRLWELPNVTISPHVAGVSRARDIAKQFKENLLMYVNNQSIPATLDINKGY